jgi:hypothetical protein
VIGLLFLGALILWLLFMGYLTVKVPRWLRLKGPVKWLARLLLVPLLAVVPFVDHIVGMRQFERLCEEKAILRVFPNADQVKRAKVRFSDSHPLPGYLINISTSRSEYIDLDTGQVFMTWDNFNTRGGLIGGMEYLGWNHGCSAQRGKQFESIKNRINIQSLLDKGYKS